MYCVYHLLGALIYMLNLFCNSTSPTVREQTASLLGKMIGDKLVGPKVRIILTKFLPLIFMDAMKDNPEASITMFESEYCCVNSHHVITALFYKFNVFKHVLISNVYQQ